MKSRVVAVYLLEQKRFTMSMLDLPEISVNVQVEGEYGQYDLTASVTVTSRGTVRRIVGLKGMFCSELPSNSGKKGVVRLDGGSMAALQPFILYSSQILDALRERALELIGRVKPDDVP